MNSEYNAFGPWIYEVSDEHPLPPLFIPYYKEDENYLMLIKIPRNMERRDAKPGMDLYDYVIGMYEDYIYLLQRKEKLVEETRILYSEIEGIEDIRELLRGTLNIYLRNNKLVIPFNTVSSNIIVQLIKIIRERYTKKTFEVVKDIYFNKDIKVDDLYVNIIREIKSHNEGEKICAIQSSVPVTSNRDNFLQKILYFLTGKILLNTLHLSNNKELIIINRGKTFKRRNEANYSYTFIYMPIERLCGFKIDKNEKYENLMELNIKLFSYDFRIVFEQINRDLIGFYNDLNECISLIRA